MEPEDNTDVMRDIERTNLQRAYEQDQEATEKLRDQWLSCRMEYWEYMEWLQQIARGEVAL